MSCMIRTYPKTSKHSTWEFHQQTPNRKQFFLHLPTLSGAGLRNSAKRNTSRKHSSQNSHVLTENTCSKPSFFVSMLDFAVLCLFFMAKSFVCDGDVYFIIPKAVVVSCFFLVFYWCCKCDQRQYCGFHKQVDWWWYKTETSERLWKNVRGHLKSHCFFLGGKDHG